MEIQERFQDGAYASQLIGGDNHPGRKLPHPITMEGKVYDSTGAYLVGQLAAYDPTVHLPLFTTDFMRDVPLRTDIGIGTAVTMFTQQTWALSETPGTNSGVATKRNFVGGNSNEPEEIQIDGAQKATPLHAWAAGGSYSVFELEAAALAGQPIDQQKMVALDSAYLFQSDQQAYKGYQVGNPTQDTYGLLNSPDVQRFNLPNGASGSPTVASKTAREIIADLTNLAYYPYAASGFRYFPNVFGFDPFTLSYLSTQQVAVSTNGTPGSMSLLSFFLDSNLGKIMGQNVEIKPMKYLAGAGVGGTNRAIAYRKEDSWQASPVRFPWMAAVNTPVEYIGIKQRFYRYAKMGGIEFVYPQTAAYVDGW